MDKAIEQIFKAFNHIAREIQVYFLSGFLVVANCLLLDHFYFKGSLLEFITTQKLIIPTAILAYLIGQFCMAFYYVVFELTRIEKVAGFLICVKYKKVPSEKLPKIFAKDKEAYSHFIERYVLLVMMRCTLCAAAAINFFTDVVFWHYQPVLWQLKLITILFLIAAIGMLVLTRTTENDYVNRIESMAE